MNLAQAVEYWLDNLPLDPCGQDEILNECIKNVQEALGQPYGDDAGIYFSGMAWYDKWINSDSREVRKQVVFDYIKYELNHLPIS